MTKLYSLALLCKSDQILLLRRYNATFASGQYSLPGGKVEEHETALQAIVREIHEELGLTISKDQLHHVHAFHRKASDTTLMACIFKADVAGDAAPYNREPDKHDSVDWFDKNHLPENIIPAHKQAIEYIFAGKSYSEHGWK